MFAVRASSMRPGRRWPGWHSQGELLISPGAVRFSPSVSSQTHSGVGELAHTQPKIALTTARLRPPWSNTFLYLQGHESSYVRVGPSLLRRHKLRRALSESGVTVHEETCWRSPQLPAGSGLAASVGSLQ